MAAVTQTAVHTVRLWIKRETCSAGGMCRAADETNR